MSSLIVPGAPMGVVVKPAWSSLRNSLAFAYGMGEANSAARLDSSGNGLTLTNNNGVTQVAGKVGNASQFTAADSEYLSSNDAGLDIAASDRVITCWIRLDTVGVTRTIYAKRDEEGTTRRGFNLQILDTDILRLAEGSGLQADQVLLSATTFGALSANTWYMITTYYDSSATGAEYGIMVNNANLDTAAKNGNPVGTSNDFEVGAKASAQYLDGRVDALNGWTRKLTSDELDSVYNSGNGLEHPF